MHNKSESKTNNLDLKGLGQKELRDILSDKRQELELERVKNKLGKSENPSVIKKIRRNIARVLTAMSQTRGTKG